MSAEAVCAGSLGGIDVIHLHDWHAAPLAFLRAYAPEFEALKFFSVPEKSVSG